MQMEYQHDGVFYHEPLPRILLVNFSPSLGALLREQSHNAKVCESRPVAQGRQISSPVPSYETDIVLVRDKAERQPEGPIQFTGTIEWAPDNSEPIGNFASRVASRKGACI